ncbi:MAG: hypothetical protein EOO43_15980 [Flavobacterium sp.]|nr:MAG: hypothetical protein EOO43_15980 [Flavobacterium sp.]
MKRQLLYILFLLSFNGYSQACGGGILTLTIYTINGDTVKDVSYEVFPASEEFIERQNFRDISGSGIIITDFSESKNVQADKSADKFKTLLARSSLFKSGKFTSTLNFKTIETEYFPVVVKITIKDKSIYILGNYFGGCDREAGLFWNGKYIGLIQ